MLLVVFDFGCCLCMILQIKLVKGRLWVCEVGWKDLGEINLFCDERIFRFNEIVYLLNISVF